MYLQMILGIYATLGVFLLIASRDPLANRSLIWFTVWSSIVHGGIMAAQSIVFPEHHGHLLGDVPALLIVAVVLALLTPRRTAETAIRYVMYICLARSYCYTTISFPYLSFLARLALACHYGKSQYG